MPEATSIPHHSPHVIVDQDQALVWTMPEEDLFQILATSPSGLTTGAAAKRLATVGSNTLSRVRRRSDLWLLLRQFTNPIVLILIAATLLSIALGDIIDAAIILAIIIASGLLGFWQERGATQTVEALLASIAIQVEVRRDGQTISISLEEVVPGDIVVLNAGDVIPGDGRVLSAEALLIDEAALTGESYSIDKAPGSIPEDVPLTQRSNALFMGSHVASGNGTALIINTGSTTVFGHLASDLESHTTPTSFERGITRYGYLLMRATVALVIAIFAVNLVLGRPPADSFLFSVALAVGLTPQLLPAIITVSLSAGARQLAREQVIVKRLAAIEDVGSMTVLCTDKTGTITEGDLSLTMALDASGQTSEETARLAWLNARLQTGYTNPLDAAIMASCSFSFDSVQRIDEVPYDFSRKRLSVLVREDDATQLITKGALEPLLEICTRVAVADRVIAIEDTRTDIQQRFYGLSSRGFRVLGIATRSLPGAMTCTVSDEHDLTFIGFLAFSDPPKRGAREAISELADLGILVRIITGDNRLAAAHAGAAVGLPADQVLTGSAISELSDAQLVDTVGTVTIFAEIEPMQKERIIRALQAAGQTVGYLGDGINDAPALHTADAGISVDTAVDVAKQSASIVLLDKHLAVIADGVRLGRRTFANTLKYINVTTSANFGNMLSMAAAAAVLPFLPLLPRQILLLNFLSDIPGTTIAGDRVDPEQLERPRTWDIVSIRTFMFVFGGVSSVFDIATFAILRLVLDAPASLFRSAWFVESVLTELAVMLVLRTRRPFYRSRPSRALVLTSIVVGLVTLALPFSPLAGALGLRMIPVTVLLALGLLTLLYILATEGAKALVSRHLRR